MTKRLFYQQSEPGSRIAATAQRLSVKARIMMALFALMLIPQGTWAQGNSYNLWIGGTRVTDSNKGALHVHNNALGAASGADSVLITNTTEGGSITFDSDNNVLILKNVNLQREIRSGLDNLTIRFEGTNKINSYSRDPNDYLSAYAYGIITYDPTSTSNPLPLHPSATLTIEKSGDGSLELDGRDTYSAVKGFASVSYGSGCYLKSDVATTYNENLKLYESFCGGGYVGVVTITTDTFYPLWFYYKETTSPFATHFKQVDGNNYSNISTETLTKGTISFDPANSKLSLNDVIFDGKILSSLGDLTINLTSTNQINLSDSGTCILSAKSGKLTLEKAAPNASLKLDCWQWNPTHPVIQGFTSLVYPDFSLVTSPAAGYGNFFDDNSNSNTILGLYYPGETDNTIKAVNDAEFTSVVSYGLSIAGTSITSVNKDNVFAGDALYDGKVTFLPDATTANSGTLTLTDFKKTSSAAAIVSSLDNLIVEFSGTNELGSASGNAGYIKSSKNTATLTFKGGTSSSTLSLHGNSTSSDAVVHGFASVSYDGAYWNYSGPITYKTYSATPSQYENEYGALTLLTITTTPQYLLWITDIQVSADNYNEIMGSGDTSVTYDDASKTLTLDGCNISSLNGIVSALPNLNIKLKGHNTIFTYYTNYTPIVSSVPTATLNIQKADGVKNGSLTLKTMGRDPVVKGFSSVNHSGLEFELTEGTGTTLTDNNTFGAILRSLSFSGGDGTPGNPYLIATKEDLNDLATVVNSEVLNTSNTNFKVTASIDCSNLSNFTPIAYDEYHAFAGSLDGNGYTISNLQAKADYAGLFGYVKDGTISNLTLHNCNFIADNDYSPAYAGTIAGTVDGSSIISNIKVTGTSTVSVSTPNGTNAGFAGALFGEVESGTPSNNYYEYTVKVTGHDNVLKTGYTPRGDGSTGGDITASDGAVLYTQTLNTAAVANGTIVPYPLPSNTYTNNGKFAPGQTAYFKVTPATGYAIDASSPKVTYTAAGASQTINGTLETSYSSDGVNVYSFTMPDATDVTATASMLVNISDAVYSATIAPGTYSPTGSLAPTTVKLTPKGSTSDIILNSPNDFTITAKTLGGTAAEFTNAGDYVVTIQGTGNYTGSRNVNYTINPKSVVGLEVNVSGTYTYTGSAIQPTSTNIEVKDGSKTLTSGTDYTIYTYSNNVDVADANDPTAPPTVTIKGMGNYDSKTTENGHFTIAQADFTTTTLLSIAAVADQTYTGSEITPTPTVTFNGTPLTAGTDFEFSYANNKNAALSTATPAPTVIVTGKGNFTGTSNKTFTIEQADFTKITLTIDAITAQTYTGSEIKPTPTVTFAGTQLVPGTDFDYSYANNTNAALSTATPAPTVTLNGKGNFTGTSNVKFTIDQADLSTSPDVEIATIDDQVYTGTAITPTPTVKFNGKALTEVIDFSYSYTNNVNAADKSDTPAPTVTINGNGNFKNSKPVTFTILDRTATIPSFGSGRSYMTFCDPSETFLVPDNVTAYIVTAVSGSTVTIQQVSYIPASTPVLLESTPGTTNTKNTGDTFAGNMLSFAAADVATNGNQYVLYSDEFVKATGTIPAGKVYLTFTSPVRRLTIDRNNSATAIEAIVEEAADGEQWYDMQGRKINKPTKDGLYIKNGKKVVVNNK